MPPDICILQNPTPRELVQSLRQKIARLEGTRRPTSEVPVSSGCRPVDKLLPGQGFRRGTLVEWLARGPGSGVESLALLAAREASREGGALVVFDRTEEFYPPAAIRLGIDPQGMIVVQVPEKGTGPFCRHGPRPTSGWYPASHKMDLSPFPTRSDFLWALDQALRCPAVAAVLAWPEELDGRTFRRLQLAAEQGGGLGLFVRPERARHEPSWAEVRLVVEPLPATAPDAPRRLKVELLRCRGGPSGASVEVELDDETHPLHPASRRAHPATRRRAAGA